MEVGALIASIIGSISIYLQEDIRYDYRCLILRISQRTGMLRDQKLRWIFHFRMQGRRRQPMRQGDCAQDRAAVEPRSGGRVRRQQHRPPSPSLSVTRWTSALPSAARHA